MSVHCLLPCLCSNPACGKVTSEFYDCHVGIHWIALAEHSQMSTHVPGFQSFLFLAFLHHFVLAKLANSSIRVKGGCVLRKPCEIPSFSFKGNMMISKKKTTVVFLSRKMIFV